MSEAGASLALTKSSARFILIAGILLATAAALGAIGSHVLRGRIEPPRLESFQLAVAYQFYHGLGLLAAAWLADRLPTLRAPRLAGWLFVGGIVAFSGSIYARSFGMAPLPFPAAPTGGLMFIAGWLTLAVAGASALRQPR